MAQSVSLSLQATMSYEHGDLVPFGAVVAETVD